MKHTKKLLMLGSTIAASLFLASCDDDNDNTTSTTQTQSRNVQITFQATGPVAFAPILFATHDGTFDFFDTGSGASASLETMAEVGDISSLQADLPAGTNNVASGAPTAPGATFTLNLTIDQANRYFTYAGMVLPSSDTFIGNNNPQQFDILQLLDQANGNPVTISVDRMYDAGTEVNDFLTSPGGPLVGAPTGVASNGVVENGSITLATPNHFDAYLNSGTFNASSINPGGAEIGRITITVRP